MLEARFHEHSVFSTFTYEVEPDDGSVNPKHVSSTFKRLRARLAERALAPVRFFACGEYGQRGGRPHYHAAIFGLHPSCVGEFDAAWESLVSPCGAVAGFTRHGTLTADSAAYVSGYVSQKLGGSEEARAAALGGRRPEFALMSRRPGIGLVALPSIVEALTTKAGAKYIAENKDVPTALSIGGRLMPLGSYLRQRLRIVLFGEAVRPQAAKEAHERLFYATRLPFVPPDASPSLRAFAASFFHQQAKETYNEHLQTLEAKRLQSAWRTEFNSTRRKL